MLRCEIIAQRDEKDFERRREQEVSSIEKRIPKLSIMHKIERVHRAKCPSFNIESCLHRKKPTHPSLPEQATR